MLVELEWLGPRPSQVAFVGQSPFRRCCGLAASTAPSHDHDLGLFGARKAAWQTPTPGACSSRSSFFCATASGQPSWTAF